MSLGSNTSVDSSFKEATILSSDKLRHQRLLSIDILRGLVIVLMALDHTRDYWGSHFFSPTDLTQTDMAWFFTRWVTHFCAPIFIFLTGVSAYLYGRKCLSKSQLRNYLLSRGLWLIILEVTWVNISWQFGIDYVVLQVIWVIGISMVILAGLIYLPMKVMILICLPVCVLHNLFDDKLMVQLFGSWDWLWFVLHEKHWISIVDQGFGLFLLYPIIPWFAVMGLGYVAGSLYMMPADVRRHYLLVFAVILFMVFLIFRGFGWYGDPMVWQGQAAEHQSQLVFDMMSFLNVTKYPPSFLYLCMTLSCGLFLLAMFECIRSDKSLPSIYNVLHTFGRVPMFFYLLHIPLLNASAHIYSYLRYGEAVNFLKGASVFPDGYTPVLWLTYLVWILLLLMLYYPCFYYGKLKRRSKHVMWSYL